MNKFRASLLSLTALTAFGLSLPAGVSTTAYAQTANSSDTVIAQPVNTLYQAILKTQGKAGEAMTSQQRFDTLKPAIVGSYDLDGILHKTLGGRFNKLPPEQKSALAAAFERFTIAHYVADFKPSANVVFTVEPNTTVRPDGSHLVKTTVRGKDDDADKATVLCYLMSDKGNQGWRIMDVLVSGSISQVAIQRFDFLAQFRLGGVDHLTKTLNEKADKYLAEH